MNYKLRKNYIDTLIALLCYKSTRKVTLEMSVFLFHFDRKSFGKGDSFIGYNEDTSAAIVLEAVRNIDEVQVLNFEVMFCSC